MMHSAHFPTVQGTRAVWAQIRNPQSKAVVMLVPILSKLNQEHLTMRTKKANAKAAETRVADSNPLLDYPERFLGEMKRLHYSADSSSNTASALRI